MSFADVRGGGFSSRGGERNDPAGQLSQMILEITVNVGQITKLVGMLGTPQDSHELRVRLKDIMTSTRKVALDANKAMKDIPQEGIEQERKFNKLKNDFSKSLESFQDVSRVAGRKLEIIPTPAKKEVPQQETLAGGRAWEEDDGDEMEGLVMAERRQQLAQLESARELQNSIIMEREEGIKDIEAGIQEVNSIFIDLATLVQEQAPMIDNIESNINSTVSNTAKGVVELHKAADYQRSQRTKLCCIILVVLLIVAVVVVALVVGLNFGLRK